MKRKTKAEREAEQRAALFVRVRDVYSGACGEEWLEELDGEQQQWLSMESAGRAIRALRLMFQGDKPEDRDECERAWLFKTHNLAKFESATSATDWLFEHGVRA